MNVVCCQVQVSVTDRFLVHKSPTDSGVTECDREVSIIPKPWPTRGCRAKVGIELTGNDGTRRVTDRQS